MQSDTRRIALRRLPKLHTDGALFEVVRHYLEALWSPQQITNILRAMRPDGSDKTVSICSQDALDAIARSLNTRPRATLGWKTPLAVYTEHMARLQLRADSLTRRCNWYLRPLSGNWLRWFEQKMKLLKQRFEVVLLTIDSVK